MDTELLASLARNHKPLPAIQVPARSLLAVRALQLRDGDRVLEVGCGYGWITQALLEAAKIRWVGVDLSESMVPELRASLAAHQPDAFIASAYHLPFPAESSDKVGL